MEIARLSIPHGEAGTEATVQVMRAMIEDGKRDQVVRQLAERILRRYNVPRYRYVAELASLHDWVRRNVRYTKDPHEVEYIQTPRRLLQTRMGDCDDMAVLLGSLSEVVGHPVGIKVVSRDLNRNFHHVYPVAEIDGHEYGLDASVPFPFGYQSPDIKRQKVFPSNGVVDMKSVYFGLGKIPPGGGGDGPLLPNGDNIKIAFGKDPLGKVSVSAIGPGARICGPDVAERIRAGTIRPLLPTMRLRLLSAAESGAGVPCVIAEKISVYDQPIEPPVPGLPPPADVIPPEYREPIIIHPPPGFRKPDVFMPPPAGAIIDERYREAEREAVVIHPTEAERRKRYEEPIVIHPPPDFLRPVPVAEKSEEGPLGLPWIVWVGAAGLLATVLMKK